MAFTDPTHDEWISPLEAIDSVQSLPDSQAFEQVMYDNLCQRTVHFAAEKPIVFDPALLATQFPEQLRDVFIFSHNFNFSSFEAVQLLQQDDTGKPERFGRMVFTVNDIEHSFTTDGITATLEAKTPNGPSKCTYPDALFTALLASVGYAMQYDRAHPQKAIELSEDPLLRRRDCGDPMMTEALIEQIIMTMGEFQGKSSTTTISLFDIGEKIIQAKLRSIENPRVSGVQSDISLAELSLAPADEILLTQNISQDPSRKLELRQAKIARHVLAETPPEPDFITPDQPKEWAEICQKFSRHIDPLLKPYQEIENPY